MKLAVEQSDIPITYISKFNEYGIQIADGGESYITFGFCPWCGTKLPDSLREAWFDALEHLGIDPATESIPEEYSDQRWYRKLSN